MADGTGGIEGKVALVTGGTGGLGRHVVRTLLEAGAVVHASWVDEAELVEVRDSLREAAGRGGGELLLHRCDGTDDEAVSGLFRAIDERSGPAEILLNVAGGFACAPIEETEPASWDAMMALNARTAYLHSRAAVPGMRRIGGGRIVNFASIPALDRGQAGLAAYAAAKAAVLNLTGSLSKELVSDGITVNAILPSIIDTPGNRQAMPEADRSAWLPPDEISRIVLFLVGPEARIVTGAALTLSLG